MNHASRPSFVVPVLPAKIPCAPRRRAERAGAAVHDSLQDRVEDRDRVGVGAPHDGLVLRLDAPGVRAHDAEERVRPHAEAAVRERAVGGRDLHRARLEGAERERRVRPHAATRSRARRAVSTMSGRSVRPGAVSVTAMRTVGMLIDCSSACRAGHRPAELAVVVLRRPRLVLALAPHERDRRVDEDRRGRDRAAARSRFPNAVRYTNGLKSEPGWRRACTTRLNWLTW